MAEKSKFADRHVDFALSHSSHIIPTLTAWFAISRCEQLLSDLDALAELKVGAEKSNQPFGCGWFGFDIISYYAVGFVTCLEWHARSRLVDLLCYEPNSIEVDDLKSINGSLLSQSIKRKASVPHLVGAITKISDFDRYCEVFARVLRQLKVGKHPKQVVSDLEPVAKTLSIIDDFRPSLSDMLDDLYIFRNHLVHEIDLSIIGSYTLRNNWDIDTARKYGLCVRLLMRELEKLITMHSAEIFPNRLDADGYPIDQIKLLERRIREVEGQIEAALDRKGNDEEKHAWQRTLAANSSAGRADQEFVEGSDFFEPLRYFDRHGEFKRTRLRLRLEYLEALHAEIGADSDGSDEPA